MNMLLPMSVLNFVILLTQVPFAVQNVNLTSTRVSISDLIAARVRQEDCNLSLDDIGLAFGMAFSPCDWKLPEFERAKDSYFGEEVYLCWGIYDVVLHICSLEKTNISVSNSNHDVLKEMEIAIKSETYSVKSICKNMKGMQFEPASEETKPWLSGLKTTLQKSCENTCTKGDKVNPLCIFILWGNIFRAEPNEEKKQEKDVPAEGSKLLEKTINTEYNASRNKISPFTDQDNVVKPEEVTNISNKKEATPVDSSDFPSQADNEPKIPSSESNAKNSLTTLGPIEAAQHLEPEEEVEDHFKGEVALPEPPTTGTWKISSFTRNAAAVEQTDQFPATQEEENDLVIISDEENDSGIPSYRKHFVNTEDSHFFAYFMAVVAICIIAYLIYHNKHKFLALILEGRRRREMRRRTSHGGYRKLDSNLEEAVTSTCSTSVTHVIY